MSRGMRELGHSVSIFSPSLADGSIYAGSSTVPLTIRRRIRMNIAALSGIFTTFPADIATAAATVHNGMPIDIFEIEESFGYSEDLQRALPFPIVTRVHGPHFLGQVDLSFGLSAIRDRLRIRREGSALRNATVISSMSSSLLEKTFQYYGLNHPSWYIIPNPVACGRKPAWEVGNSDANLILFVGRFDARKGGDIALQAFSILAEKLPNLRLVFAGADLGLKMVDGSTIGIMKYIETHLPDWARRRVDYVGVRGASELDDLRIKARVALMTSRFEAQPYALFEAMALGAPVVTSGHFAAIDHITSGQNGIVVPIADIRSTADALEAVLTNDDLASRIGREAWKLCKERFDLQLICRQTEGMYRSVIGCELN